LQSDIADLLSTKIIGARTSLFSSSPRSLLSQSPWHPVVEAAMYSASQEDAATTRCFCDCQLIGL
jgi:hypothetical protein